VKKHFLRASVLLAILSLSLLANVGCAGFSSSKGNSDPPLNLSISGTISPLASGAGVTMTMTGAATATVTTDSSGNYSFGGLANGTYTLTPSKSGVTFSPTSQNISIITANATQVNFTASDGSSSTFNITGTVSPAAAGTGVTVTLSGAVSAATVTDNNGNYGFGGLASGSYTLTPSNSGYSFSPASQSETVSTADVTGVNFTASQGGSGTTYSISGTISPIAYGSGATVTLSGTSSATTTSDSSGNYSFTGLASGAYTVTAAKSGFTLNPTSLPVTVSGANVTGVNFTAYSGSVVTISPGTAIQSVVDANPSGTTFVLQPGTYRLQSAIIPQNGDTFIGQTVCAPPTTSCLAIISGSTEIGSLATFDGTNYKVTGQTQQGAVGTQGCETDYPGCIYPEALFFDGVPYQHLYSSALPTIGSGQWWFDYTNHIIYFHDSPSGHVVETSVTPEAFTGIANNVTIGPYLEIEQFASTQQMGAVGNSPSPASTTQGNNWVVQGNDIRLNSYYGVAVSFGWQVLNNYIYKNGTEGISGGTPLGSGVAIPNSGVLIQGNSITYNNFAGVSPGYGAGGIKLGRIRAPIVRGNTIQFNNGEGIHFDDWSEFPLADGNLITDNTDADGLFMEISGTGGNAGATFRNNTMLRNGTDVNTTSSDAEIVVSASSNVQAYCNVIAPKTGYNVFAMDMSSAARGDNPNPPGGYAVTTGNYFHHNTVIWLADNSGSWVGGENCDSSGNDPNFFTANPGFDYNTYHIPTTSTPAFRWDGSGNSCPATGIDFSGFQAATQPQDTHGSIDTNTSSGYPSVNITSPADQTVVGTSPVTVSATASDTSGISQVQFYVDWTLAATLTDGPYSYSWPPVAGSHVIAAMAKSNAGVQSCWAITLTEQ